MTEEVIHPLVALREERNLTQIQLAEAIRLGSRTIWAAEHNKPISADSRRRLCRFFKKSARELGLIAAESKARERKRQKRSNQSVSVPQPIVASLSQEQSQITEVISTSSLTKLLQTGLVSVFIQDISLEAASVDCTIWFNEKLVQLLAEIDLWKGRALFCEQLQTIL